MHETHGVTDGLGVEDAGGFSGEDGGAEHGEARGFGACGGVGEAGRFGVVSPGEESFGVRHEAEDAAGGVGESGDVACGAVGVGDVAECDAVAGFELGEEGGRADEATFAVGEGEADGRFVVGAVEEGGGPDAVGGGVGGDGGPVVDEAVGVVGGEGDDGRVRAFGVGLIGGGGSGEEAGLDEDLEAVADAEDACAAFVDGVAEVGVEA